MQRMRRANGPRGAGDERANPREEQANTGAHRARRSDACAFCGMLLLTFASAHLSRVFAAGRAKLWHGSTTLGGSAATNTGRAFSTATQAVPPRRRLLSARRPGA